MNYFELLTLAAPETIVVITALVVLALDLTTMRGIETRVRFAVGGMVTCVGCVAAIGWLIVMQPHGHLGTMFVADSLTAIVKAAILVLTAFTALLSIDTKFTTHVGEYLSLILMAAAGMMFLVGAEDVLMVFVSLELTSLSLYILTAFNKRNAKSAEAALKYFLFGGVAAAFTLFGLSLLYGLSGSTNLEQIAAALKGKGLDPLLIVAIVMTVIGFGFKVAAVPFHLWAPDAYEGAPTPSAAFIASGSKVASFVIAAKVMMIGFAGAEGSAAWRDFTPGWVSVIAIGAALSMVLGNFVAITQVSVRRLIAYSAIAHAGYALLGILSNNMNGMASLVYYVTTYGLTTVGAFGVVGVVEQGTGDAKLSDFAGLSRRAPIVSLCMMVFMLSLAGIPPLAGFFGKFYVFTAAVGAVKNAGLLWLVIIAIAMSAVSLYYYLQVLKQIYVADVPNTGSEIKVSAVTQVSLALLAIGVILFGCAPGLLLRWIENAVHAVGA
jgi:NADH-quinone oxidoreductase subunit N